MGCLNPKSTTADGKAPSKLPEKEKKAPPAAPATAAAKEAAAKPAQAPTEEHAQKPVEKPVEKPAKAPDAVAPAPEPEAPAEEKSSAKAPAVSAAEWRESESPDTSCPPSVPATTPPSVAKPTEVRTASVGKARSQATESPSGDNKLADILRAQVEKQEATSPPESRERSPKSERARAASTTLDGDDSVILPEEADEIREAAVSYTAGYKERMGHMRAPRNEDKAAPFIGFSLADNIKEGVLVVDGVFHEGPAYQVGVDVDHELLSIAGRAAKTILGTRELVSRFCHPGRITQFKLRNLEGETYEVPLYVLTADTKYEGKPYFFDTTKHEITQSDRLKQTWRESSSPNR